jgi:hypothetical protein
MKLFATFSTWFVTVTIGLAQLTIIVDQVPVYTPPENPVHIAGDFQGWDPGNPDFHVNR